MTDNDIKKCDKTTDKCCKRGNGEDNWSFEDQTAAKKLTVLINI